MCFLKAGRITERIFADLDSLEEDERVAVGAIGHEENGLSGEMIFTAFLPI